MGAPYRQLQSDFSAGQIDQMVEANLNLSYKKIGLKESLNTIHNVNRTVSKRPGTKLEGLFFDSEYTEGMENVSLTLPNGETLTVFFDDSHTRLVLADGSFYEDTTHVVGSVGPYSTAVYQNFLFVVGKYVPLVKIFAFVQTPDHADDDEDEPGTSTLPDFPYMVENVSLTYGNWKNKPSCVKNANTHFNACYVAGGRLFLSHGTNYYYSRIRVPGLLEEKANGFPSWMLDFSLGDNMNTIPVWELGGEYWTDEGGNDALEPEENQVYYVVDENIYIQWNGTSFVNVGPVGHTYIDSSHGFEGMDNDFQSSDIKWITSLGRIVMATENGLFMSTSQGIDPTTFDMVQTSSYGSCEMQPIVVSNMIFFLSSDKRKIYAAYFQSDYQGLIVVDVTANARDMFFNGIKDFWAFDFPELSVYAVTEDGRFFFCQPSYADNGIMIAWSEWKFPLNEKVMAVFKVRPTGNLPRRIMMAVRLSRFDEGGVEDRIRNFALLTVDFQEPYADDTGRPMMDYMTETETTRQSSNVITVLNDNEYEDDVPITFFIRPKNSDTAPVVLRNLHFDGNSISITIPQNIEGFYDEGDLLPMTIVYGVEYVSRMTLFQQIFPNNSGIALSSKHFVREVSVMVFRSFGGYLEVAGRKAEDLPYLKYGYSSYSANMYDFTKEGVYGYTGVLRITNPRYIGVDNADNKYRDVVEDDRVAIVHDRPFPFNLMAISIAYNLTEVN